MNPVLEVNKKNLIENFRLLKSKTSSSFVCPMVKANSYGVGDIAVVAALSEVGASTFGVVKIEEAQKLRRFFSHKDFNIILFSPLQGVNINDCVDAKITLTVGDEKTLSTLENQPANLISKLKPVHIKFNLGMNRLGFSFSDAESIFNRLKKINLKIDGVLGHFPKATDLVSEQSESTQILEKLIRVARSFGLENSQIHALNSEAIFAKEDLKLGIRPGISLYGIGGENNNTGLKGVLALQAPIVAINKIKAGEAVSYGGTWVAKEDGYIGVLPIGYADGLRRGLSNRINFKVLGQMYQQVGTICMDYTMVSLNQDAHIKVGDNAMLFDTDYVQLYRWANLLGTIPYEILTGLGNRIERRVI